MWDVGTVGGYGPTTSVAYRRESTGSAPSRNCNNAIPSAAGGVVNTPTTICYAADGAGGGQGVPSGYALWRRYGSGVFYDSPTFSGFQFRLGYQPNESKSVASTELATSGLGGNNTGLLHQRVGQRRLTVINVSDHRHGTNVVLQVHNGPHLVD